MLKYHSGEAEWYLHLDEVYLSWSCTRCPTTDSGSSPPRPGASTTRRSRVVLAPGHLDEVCNVDEVRQVHRGAAEVYLSSHRVNIAKESGMGHRVQLQGNVNKVGGKYTEAQPRCTCPPTELTLPKSLGWGTEGNSKAMLTRWEASTPRRSRGVLVLPRVNIA